LEESEKYLVCMVACDSGWVISPATVITTELLVEKVQEQELSGFNVEDATTIGNAAAAPR